MQASLHVRGNQVIKLLYATSYVAGHSVVFDVMVNIVLIDLVAQDSYSGSGSTVLSSGSTSSILGMVAPDAVIPQQQQVCDTYSYTFA